jgi:Predicted signal-transduction protein containing cAMP-binding and CBS domains
MTEDVTTTKPQKSIQDAAVKMITQKIQHLPVVEDQEVVGMLSTTDLTTHLTYMDSSDTE